MATKLVTGDRWRVQTNYTNHKLSSKNYSKACLTIVQARLVSDRAGSFEALGSGRPGSARAKKAGLLEAMTLEATSPEHGWEDHNHLLWIMQSLGVIVVPGWSMKWRPDPHFDVHDSEFVGWGAPALAAAARAAARSPPKWPVRSLSNFRPSSSAVKGAMERNSDEIVENQTKKRMNMLSDFHSKFNSWMHILQYRDSSHGFQSLLKCLNRPW